MISAAAWSMARRLTASRTSYGIVVSVRRKATKKIAGMASQRSHSAPGKSRRFVHAACRNRTNQTPATRRQTGRAMIDAEYDSRLFASRASNTVQAVARKSQRPGGLRAHGSILSSGAIREAGDCHLKAQ